MKIATWNVARPTLKSISRNAAILAALKDINADILILTETNAVIDPGEEYHQVATELLPTGILFDSAIYTEGENRTTIWSKYPVAFTYTTFNNFTSVCSSVITPLGELIIYGTVIGITGNRNSSFKTELENQLADWKQLITKGNVCIAGDYNISFSDNYYYTNDGRNRINAFLKEYDITNTTQELTQNIDHIAISSSFLDIRSVDIYTWNKERDKKISDHLGVCITIYE